jgi:hypothetical protein
MEGGTKPTSRDYYLSNDAGDFHDDGSGNNHTGSGKSEFADLITFREQTASPKENCLSSAQVTDRGIMGTIGTSKSEVPEILNIR